MQKRVLKCANKCEKVSKLLPNIEFQENTILHQVRLLTLRKHLYLFLKKFANVWASFELEIFALLRYITPGTPGDGVDNNVGAGS